ncbi:MAG: flagellar biosynthetic protein FliR [Bacillota bacterium]
MESLSGNFSSSTYLFIIILIRYTGLFLITPLFSSKMILSRIKIGLAFLLSIITFPLIKETATVEFPGHLLILTGDVIQELSVGFLIGFIVLLVFSAVQLAGQFIDLRMGFRIVNVFDPLTGASSPIMGQYKNIIVTLVFLVINGHHLLLKSLFKSFEIIPPGKAIFVNNLWQFIFRRSADMFLIAFKIALPVMGTIFVVDIILGFLARSVP